MGGAAQTSLSIRRNSLALLGDALESQGTPSPTCILSKCWTLFTHLYLSLVAAGMSDRKPGGSILTDLEARCLWAGGAGSQREAPGRVSSSPLGVLVAPASSAHLAYSRNPSIPGLPHSVQGLFPRENFTHLRVQHINLGGTQNAARNTQYFQ